jgi:hypothetical protein
VAPHLPAELLRRAFEVALGHHYRDDWDRARVLAALAPHLPVELVAAAVVQARRVPNPQPGIALAALGPRLRDRHPAW